MTRTLWFGLGLLVLLVCSLGAAVSFGSAQVSFGDVYRVLLHHLTATPTAAADWTVDKIIWNLRLPRVLMAFVVGGGLAIVGVAMQALVRNPLAEPYILGISSGASAGASLYYLGFLPALLSRTFSLATVAFLGGLAAILVVYFVAHRGRTLSVTRLLLAGVAVAALMGAVTSFIIFSSPTSDRLLALIYWMQGSLNGTVWHMLPLPTITTALAFVLLVSLARPLDALLLGEEPAQSLGVPVEGLKRLLILLSAFVTGTLVAFTGAIGFIGLIVPHTVRLVVGIAHRRVLLLSFLAGAVFLLWADLAARTLIPRQEIPVGVVTALCGVPFFLYLLRKSKYRFG